MDVSETFVQEREAQRGEFVSPARAQLLKKIVVVTALQIPLVPLQRRQVQ